MDPDETARMRRLIWIHAGRKRTRLTAVTQMYAVTEQPASYGAGSQMPGLYQYCGLDCLGPHSEVLLRQDFLYIGSQFQMKFDIRDATQRHILSVEDDIAVKTWTHFTMNVTDTTSTLVMQLKQTVVGCDLDIQITDAHGLPLAYVTTGCYACMPHNSVLDDRGNLMAVFTTGCCDSSACGDFVLQIRDPRGTEIGRLIFIDEGCCGIYRNFSLQFGPEMDVTRKVVLLGASMIIIAHYRKRGPPSN